MKNRFPLFQSHIDLAHAYWKTVVHQGDIAIDATCGNGYDTLALSKMALSPSEGTVYSIDIQQAALNSAKQLLSKHVEKPIYKRVQWIQSCHSRFPDSIEKNSVKVIAYNLGYLPGGNKAVTTVTKTTLKSISHAMELIQYGGIISMTCYPGHPEGSREETELIQLLSTWDPKMWSCCHHRWINRSSAPSLIIMQRCV